MELSYGHLNIKNPKIFKNLYLLNGSIKKFERNHRTLFRWVQENAQVSAKSEMQSSLQFLKQKKKFGRKKHMQYSRIRNGNHANMKNIGGFPITAQERTMQHCAQHRVFQRRQRLAPMSTKKSCGRRCNAQVVPTS
ncbi:hypothetical protein PV325_014080 [Microctonus aethiopoides]|uniref:Uncharacterized protein n=1 Tax=Microctonus aethiopoides TaxID=144406 RepID=A0AA39C2A9_9HYME|nr:hypothetical protein PV326_002190 [Microctonus aethiopoides]KAK0070785.1 hypothetical protein PV325_014080 [Microctonus aethiopoides]KAK0156747.1 hypothetical protein PV328_012364 [Microctonus aethiopoides]